MADEESKAAAAAAGAAEAAPAEETVEAKLLFQVERAELYLVKHPELNKSKHEFKGALREPLAHTAHSDLLAIDTVQMVEFEDEEHGRVLLACVGDTQIPLGAETPVLRMSDLLYIVPAPEDPSFSYGLKLPDSSTELTVRAFEILLERTVDYQVARELAAAPRAPRSSNDAAFVDETLLAAALGDDDAARRAEVGATGAVVAQRAEPRNRAAEDMALIEKSKSVGGSIQQGAEKAAQGILAGAAWLGGKLRTGVVAVKEKIQPVEEAVEVSDATKARVSSVREIAGTFVQVSQGAVNGAYAAVDAMASNIAEAVKDSDYYKRRRGQTGAKTRAAVEVSRSAINATLVIVTAMEEAGVLLLEETTDAAVVVARHKYGDEVGDAAADVAAATTDVGRGTLQLSRIGMRSVAKRTVITTTKDLGNDLGDASGGPLAIKDGSAEGGGGDDDDEKSEPPPPVAEAVLAEPAAAATEGAQP